MNNRMDSYKEDKDMFLRAKQLVLEYVSILREQRMFKPEDVKQYSYYIDMNVEYGWLKDFELPLYADASSIEQEHWSLYSNYHMKKTFTKEELQELLNELPYDIHIQRQYLTFLKNTRIAEERQKQDVSFQLNQILSRRLRMYQKQG